MKVWTDCLGKEIQNGDAIVYPGWRHGRIVLRSATVYSARRPDFLLCLTDRELRPVRVCQKYVVKIGDKETIIINEDE